MDSNAFDKRKKDAILLAGNSTDMDEMKGKFSNKRIGHLIKEARVALGISQHELAIRSGVSESSISHIEHDDTEARLSTLRRIIEIGFQGELDFVIQMK